MRHFSARRPRSTPEQRADWVRRYERSGLSQQAFASRHRLSLFTLRKWIAQNGVGVRKPRQAPPVWREINLDGLPGVRCWAAEVVRPDGWVVRVAPDAPVSLLEELLRARPC